jgi:hypothetical protein
LISNNANGFFFEVDNGDGNDVFTPENTSKVITLAVNRGKATFDIIGGDADKFTLNGNKLTFKATALKDGNV